MNDIEQRLKRLEDAVLPKADYCGCSVPCKPKVTKREEIVHILAGLLSTIKPMDKTHPQDCVPFAEAALDYLEWLMPTHTDKGFITDFGQHAYNQALRSVRREVFGRES